jgi:glucosamine--fructose-6-phosphate aminotransferase (isomerizing)
MSMREEIFEQPSVLRELIAAQKSTAERIAERIRAAKPRFVFLAARGTSDNAGRYANYLWGAHNRLPIALAAPSLFTYYAAPPHLDGALVVCVSQSGESPDVVNVLEEGRRQGCLTLAITNETESPLAQKADLVFDIRAGTEAAVAATKTYTAQLAALAMISAALEDSPERWASLESTASWMEQALKVEGEAERIAGHFADMTHTVVLGRGFNYATCFEWALKLKELTYIIAEPYSSADFLHGPIALVEEGFPVLAVAPSGSVFDTMAATLTKLRNERAAELLLISDSPRAAELAQHPLALPAGMPEWVSPLVSILPAQLFTYHLALAKGYDTERPRGLNKVTRTH